MSEVRIGRGRQALVAGAALLLLGTVLAPAGAASAVPPSVPSLSLNVGPDTSSVYTRVTRTYGAVAPTARRYPVSAATTTVVARSADFVGGATSCFISGPTGSLYAKGGYANPTMEWGVTLTIPAGRIVAGSKAVYTVTCTSQAGIRIWNLVEGSRQGTAMVLTEDAAKLVASDETTIYRGYTVQSSLATSPGDRIRLYSPAGTWRLPPIPPTIVVNLHENLEDGGTSDVPGADINVTNDGSILGFSIPADYPITRTFDLDEITVASTTVLDPGSATTARRTVGSSFVLSDQRIVYDSIVTTLTVDDTTPSSTQSVRAFASAFETPYSPDVRSYPSGSVRFFVDGVEVGTRTLEYQADQSYGAVFNLPRQKPGPHIVTATYLGNSDYSPSTSVPIALTVSD